MNISEVHSTESFLSYCIYIVYKIAEIDTKNKIAKNKQKISKIIFPRSIASTIASEDTVSRIQDYFKSINVEINFTNDNGIVTLESNFDEVT